MGKKRSKIAKKKQAKAKQLGGVKITKGLLSKHKHGQQQLAASLPGDAAAAAATATTKKKKGFRSNKKKHSLASLKQPVVSDVQNAFQKEQISLHERTLAFSRQQQQQRSSKRNKKKSTLEFTNESFSLQKSTDEILNETTQQIQHMSGVGAAANAGATGNALNMTDSSLMDRASQQYTNAQELETEEASGEQNTNSFAALEEDDSDNEWTASYKRQKQQQQPLFQFAPSSFTLPSQLQQRTATTAEAEDDPDL